MQKKEKPCGAISATQNGGGAPAFGRLKAPALLIIVSLILVNGLHAQANFPEEDFWSLDAGVGMSSILVEGESFQLILDPKLWLSPTLMVGSKIGINYSTDEILTFEGQVYMRWNVLRFGSLPEKTTNVFVQGGMGMLAAYRGNDTPFDNVRRTRGSLLFDAAAGVTIPLSSRWHIEPSIRGGYPHIAGFSITAGYKIPLPEKTVIRHIPGRIQYVELIRTIPQNEIIKRTVISMIEYILFGPDIGQYNTGIDHDAESLNEMVLDEIAEVLSENPDLRVRIEGHANPVTDDPKEYDELMALSSFRADQISKQLQARGIAEEQIIVIAFGGTRTVTSDHDIWNRNRRVELIIIQLDTN